MSSTFAVRLLDGERFVYYDHTEERAGDEPHEITGQWSDHDQDDLERVMSMMDMLGHAYEIRGLTLIADPLHPHGHRWEIQPRSKTAHSPRSIAEAGA